MRSKHANPFTERGVARQSSRQTLPRHVSPIKGGKLPANNGLRLCRLIGACVVCGFTLVSLIAWFNPASMNEERKIAGVAVPQLRRTGGVRSQFKVTPVDQLTNNLSKKSEKKIVITDEEDESSVVGHKKQEVVQVDPENEVKGLEPNAMLGETKARVQQDHIEMQAAFGNHAFGRRHDENKTASILKPDLIPAIGDRSDGMGEVRVAVPGKKELPVQPIENVESETISKGGGENGEIQSDGEAAVKADTESEKAEPVSDSEVVINLDKEEKLGKAEVDGEVKMPNPNGGEVEVLEADDKIKQEVVEIDANINQ